MNQYLKILLSLIIFSALVALGIFYFKTTPSSSTQTPIPTPSPTPPPQTISPDIIIQNESQPVFGVSNKDDNGVYVTYYQEEKTYYLTNITPSNNISTNTYIIGNIYEQRPLSIFDLLIYIDQTDPSKSFDITLKINSYSNKFNIENSLGGGPVTKICFPNILISENDQIKIEISGYNVKLYNSIFTLSFYNNNIIPSVIPQRQKISPPKIINVSNDVTTVVRKGDKGAAIVEYLQKPNDMYCSSSDCSSHDYGVTNYIFSNIGINGSLTENVQASFVLLNVDDPLKSCDISFIINSFYTKFDSNKTGKIDSLTGLPNKIYLYSMVMNNIPVLEYDNIILQIYGYGAKLTDFKMTLNILPLETITYTPETLPPIYTPIPDNDVNITFSDNSGNFKPISLLSKSPVNPSEETLYILSFNSSSNKQKLCDLDLLIDYNIGFVPDTISVLNKSNFKNLNIIYTGYYGNDSINCTINDKIYIDIPTSNYSNVKGYISNYLKTETTPNPKGNVTMFCLNIFLS